MNTQQLESMRDDLRRQLRDAEERVEGLRAVARELAQAEASLTGIREAIKGLDKALAPYDSNKHLSLGNGRGTVAVGNGHVPKLRGQKAILTFLREVYPDAKSVREVADALQERGWMKPGATSGHSATRQAMRALVREGRIEHRPDHTYRINVGPQDRED